VLFHRDSAHYGLTLFAGPNYVTLWLALIGSERDPRPDVIQLRDPRCPDMNPDDVRAAVLEAVDEANARFGTRWHPTEIKFVMERPSQPLLHTAAFQIVERLATAGDAAFVPAAVPTRRGEITALLTGLQVRVRFEGGEQIDAVVPKKLAREAFVLNVGDGADVLSKPPPKMARVVRLWRSGRPIG
jgi:hypothetical protein